MGTLDSYFEEPKEVESPIRVIVMGGPGTGKSHFVETAIEAGHEVFAFATEGQNFSGGRIKRTCDILEVNKVLAAIENDYAGVPLAKRPIVSIDSFTDFWLAQQDVAVEVTEKKRRKTVDRPEFQAWDAAKRPLKRFYRLLYRTPVHVIITVRTKPGYEMSETSQIKKILPIAIVENGLFYVADMALYFDMDKDPREGIVKPSDYSAVVMKAREGKFEVGTKFSAPKFADILSAMREGARREVLGDSTNRQVKATDDDAPKSRDELEKWVVSQGGDLKKFWEEIKEKFARYDPSMLVDYWSYYAEKLDGAGAKVQE